MCLIGTKTCAITWRRCTPAGRQTSDTAGDGDRGPSSPSSLGTTPPGSSEANLRSCLSRDVSADLSLSTGLLMSSPPGLRPPTRGGTGRPVVSRTSLGVSVSVPPRGLDGVQSLSDEDRVFRLPSPRGHTGRTPNAFLRLPSKGPHDGLCRRPEVVKSGTLRSDVCRSDGAGTGAPTRMEGVRGRGCTSGDPWCPSRTTEGTSTGRRRRRPG